MSRLTNIILGTVVGILFVLTIVFVVLYVLELKKKGNWQVKISPCLTKEGDPTCGPGFQHLIYECPNKNCGTEPEKIEQPCISDATCQWEAKIKNM